MTDYYDRVGATHLDGTRIFQTEEDRRNEDEIALALQSAWGCELHRFGALSPIDWHAERYGRLVGVLELKSRPHASDKYPTVFLNVRKWLALSLATIGLGCPALFVARFSDGIFWIRLDDIDPANNRIAGCARIVKSENDREPIIDVEIGRMTRLRGRPALVAATA